MVFSNLFFLYVFFPANIILYFLTKRNQLRNVIMVAFSLVFYAWGEPVWIALLLLTAALNWLLALIMERVQDTPRAKVALVLAVAIDLSLLVIFKYTNFLYANVNALFGTDFALPGIALPIGISFYTFQIISYMADVYRKDVPAQPSFLKFLLYVTMYHQLVAGPIVRYQWIADEIDNRKTDIADIWGGLCRFFIGLTKKVVVANAAGKLAGQYLDGDLATLTSAGAIFGILLFAIQIYYDFSAYSDMAIGMGRVFGFHYMENFNYPYISRSVTDFWRRWHISLSSFFRDYVYIPLGGKYHLQLRNICIVWLLTGLWHGASWNFVLWGAYYGALLIVEKLFFLKILEKLPRVVGWAYSTVVVLVGWSIFYFVDASRLAAFLPILFGSHGFADPGLWILLQNNCFWLLLALLFCAPVVPWVKKFFDQRVAESRKPLVVVLQLLLNLALLLVSTAYLVGQSYNPFLYYRF